MVFPGDMFSIDDAIGKKQKIKIGIGLTPKLIQNNDDNAPEESILVTRTGVLNSIHTKMPKLFINNRQRRVKSFYYMITFFDYVSKYCIHIHSISHKMKIE